VIRNGKASFAGSTLGSGTRRGLLGLVCLCVLGLAAFLGISAPSASAACPNEAFRQGPSANLPDCRAYELVSPVDTGGYEIHAGVGEVFAIAPTAAASGDAVGFSAFGAFDGSESAGVTTMYLSRRGAGDWSTEGLSPPPGNYPVLHIFAVFGFTEDLGKTVMTGFWEPPLTPDAVFDAEQTYVRENATGSFRLVTTGLPEGTGETDIRAVGMSANAGHVIFRSEEELEESDCGAPAEEEYLCDWNAATSTVSLVGISPGGSVLEDSEVTLAGPNYRRSVSADGSRIFFKGGGAGLAGECGVCVRINGATTQQIVSDEGTFWSASSDSSLAFVTDGGGNLYRYDVDADELGSSLAGEVKGVLGTSTDGSRAYFVSEEEIGGEGTLGANNLYLWTDDGTPGGEITFVTTGNSSSVFTNNWNTGGFGPSSRVTPDGMHLAFTDDSEGAPEAYLYSAATGGEPVCASCNPIAAPTSGATITGGTKFTIGRLSRNLSDDGSRLFFTTDEALVPRDTNGLTDVYEYDAASGQVALISTGTEARNISFGDASTSGNDVLFATRQQLVGVDEDEALSVYDSRAGGGLAAQNPPAPAAPCTGDACRSATAPTPSQPNVASTGFVGKGNLSQKQNCNKLGREAKKLSNRAKRLRKNAKTAKRNGKSGVAKKRNKKANRLAKHARSKSKSAKKCRKRNRGASK
jgi:hypothetical protein